jgi:Rrf2 family protein
LHRLNEYGFLISVQGKYGGFKFLRNPKDINIYDLVVVFDSDSAFTSCILGLQNCSDDNPCVMHNEWSKIKEQYIELLKQTTLEDLTKNSNMRITDIQNPASGHDILQSKSLNQLKTDD